MRKKEKRSLGMRLLNSVCAFTLLGVAVFMIFAGVHLASLGLGALALAGLVAPAAASGEGFFDVVAGVFEAIVEGIVGVFEAILDLVSGLFG